MRAAFVLVPLALAFVAGCGGEQPADVSGTVLVDGVPLADGEIIFVAADDRKTPEAALVKDGKYALKVLPGAKKVHVKASRPPVKPDPVLGAVAREPALGPEYNEQTKLTIDIKPGNNPNVDFQVKALPKGK